ARWLQESLNAYNDGERLYADITIDGMLGPATMRALHAYIDERPDDNELIMYRTLNVKQGAEYLRLADADDRYERFIYGWMRKRVLLALPIAGRLTQG